MISLTNNNDLKIVKDCTQGSVKKNILNYSTILLSSSFKKVHGSSFNNVAFLYPMIFVSGLVETRKWSNGSECEMFADQTKERVTDRQTKYHKISGKITWAFISGEIIKA